MEWISEVYLPDRPGLGTCVCITDPPYGVGIKYDTYEDTDSAWFDLMWQFLPHAEGSFDMAVMPCCRITALPEIYTHFPPDWLICWYKGSPGHRAFVGFNDWEPHLVYGKRAGVTMHDYFMAPGERVAGSPHPCPKPLKWAMWLIRNASMVGDTIIDPFMGSGTTGVAAVLLNRKYIGIDISEKYCECAIGRIRDAVDSQALFRTLDGQDLLFD